MITLLCVVMVVVILCLGAGYVMYIVFKDDLDV